MNNSMDPATAVENATNATSSTVEATPAGLFVSSLVLFMLAMGPILSGSFRSKGVQDEKDVEVVSSRDAAIFPIFASGALFGIYILFKVLPTHYINLLLNLHFSIVGTGAIATLISPMLRPLMPGFVKNNSYKLEFSKSTETKESGDSPRWKVVDHSSIEVETRDLPGLAVAIAIGVWYLLTRHWVANNLVAYALAILAIQYIKLNKFINACLLLGGLFFYDIFWVFGTPVMVTVAKSLEAPIKMSFPRDFLVHGVFGKQLAILGLGDIVVPGIFIAMLLRFDVRLHREETMPYFLTGYLAYMIGLITTFIVMHVFKAAQPALLYLVPACLGSTLLLAWAKGDLEAMFAYTDVPDEPGTAPDKSTKISETKVAGKTKPAALANPSDEKKEKIN